MLPSGYPTDEGRCRNAEYRGDPLFVKQVHLALRIVIIADSWRSTPEIPRIS